MTEATSRKQRRKREHDEHVERWQSVLWNYFLWLSFCIVISALVASLAGWTTGYTIDQLAHHAEDIRKFLLGEK